MSRLLVVGLDCAPPKLVFERYAAQMPFITRLRDRGTWGPLRSSRPPITVPAWTCMVSGRDPGELGLYGFRLRKEQSYELRLAAGKDVRVKRVWDWLSEQGKTVAPLFVPLTSPPTPVRGQMVSGCLWSTESGPWCFPQSLQDELVEQFGPYIADVPEFRTDNIGPVLDDLERMAAQHFAIARYVWEEKKPDFMMMVEIAVDRLHHAAWQHMDPDHPAYVAGNRWEARARAFYEMLDREIAALVQNDDVNVMIVSDHGARAMERGFCINQWLIGEGLLALHAAADAGTALTPEMVDWSRTSAWAAGGYYARVFLNIAGREPHGIVPRRNAADTVAKIVRGLEALAGAPTQLTVDVDLPSQAYRVARGGPPDLMVYLDDLRTRAVGSVGHDELFVRENDTGPDSCNHDWNGVLALAGPAVTRRGRVKNASLYDVPRTILSIMGADSPQDILGSDLSK